MIERRKNRRLPRAEKITGLAGLGQKTDMTLLDISLGGMRIITNTELKLSSPMSLQLNILPNSGAFFIRGEVSWTKPVTGSQFEAGIKFTKISAVPF